MNNQHTPTEYEREQADNALDLIIQRKRELRDWLAAACRDLPEHAKNLRDYMQETFDDAYHDAWHAQREISQSISWPHQIPNLEMLGFETPRAKADREFKNSDEYKAQEAREAAYKTTLRPAITNPATRQAVATASGAAMVRE